MGAVVYGLRGWGRGFSGFVVTCIFDSSVLNFQEAASFHCFMGNFFFLCWFGVVLLFDQRFLDKLT